jgi:hypothetical protein
LSAGIPRWPSKAGAADVENLPTDESDRHQDGQQERPCPKAGVVVERVAEEDHEIEHQRQIKRGNDQACHGEAQQRYPRPSACDEGNEHDAGHHPAERDQPEQVALQRVAEATHALVDRQPVEPRQAPRACSDPVEREVARHHAAIDERHHQSDRHELVHDDIAAEDDCEVLVRERQDPQGQKLRQPRIIVLEKVQQG